MRIRSGFPVLAAALALAASPTWAAQEDGQNAAGDDPMVLYDKDGTTLRAHLQAGGNRSPNTTFSGASQRRWPASPISIRTPNGSKPM